MATAEELRRAREATSIFSGLFGYIDERNRRLAEQGRRPVLGGLLSKEPVMGTDTLRYEGVLPLVAGLLEPIARGVDAPRAAVQGLIPQEDMVGEALGTAGTAMVGGGAVAKPAGSLGANALFTRKPNNIGEKYFADDTVDIFKRQAQNPLSRETITYMSPQEFLNLAQKTTAGEKTENTRKVLSEGKQFSDIPFLSIENKGDGVAQVVGHEGRNRMMALAEAGVESVPVRLSMQGGDGPAIRWGSAIDPESRDYIDPTDIPLRLINEDQNMVYDMPDSSVYPITQNAPLKAGLLDVGPYKKPSEPSRLTEEQQAIQSELDEYILLNEILSDYDLSANASKSAGLLTTSAAELRRQANIQRFGYDPNETPKVDTSYRGSHQPVGPQDENPIRLDDVTKSITGEDAGYPDDFYSSQGMRLYAQPPSFPGDEYGIANQQSYRAIQAARGNPNAEVTIYRGVPDSDDITTINPGDFVTLSPKYAELHAASGYGPRGEDAGKVISQRVKVRDVYFAGDDVNEFGYFPTDVAANASKSAGVLSVVNKYPEIDIDIYGSADRGYELGKIKVPEGSQGSGVGTQVMNELISAADAEGARISLTPDTSFGGSSVSRLKDFYKRFGFVENKGRNKDFSTRNTMYRDPLMANASKPLGLLVLEQQARGNKQLGGLLQSQGMDINDLSTADPREIQGLLDIAARRGILDKRSAAGLKRGLLE